MDNTDNAIDYEIVKYKLANEALGIATWDMPLSEFGYDGDKTVVYWSAEVKQMLGFLPKHSFPDFLITVTKRIHPDERQQTMDSFLAHLTDKTGKTPFDVTFRIMNKKGDYLIFHGFGKALRNGSGKPVRVAGAFYDITEAKKVQTERERALQTLEAIMQGMDTMIYVNKPKTGEVLFMNDMMKKHYELGDDVIGKRCYKVFQIDIHERCSFCPCNELDENPDTVLTWTEHSRKTMRIYRNIDRYIDWFDGSKVHVQYSTDITEMTKTSTALDTAKKHSDIDALTGLYSRRFLEENMPRKLLTLSRQSSPLSLMIVDIDFFKKYNDLYGHPQGDECLKLVANELSRSLPRADDFVVRYGGEEFLVVLPNTDENGAKLVAAKLINNIEACNFPHKGSEIGDFLTVSIGVTTGRVRHTHTTDNFVKRADGLLYKSKQGGRNCYTFGALEA